MALFVLKTAPEGVEFDTPQGGHSADGATTQPSNPTLIKLTRQPTTSLSGEAES